MKKMHNKKITELVNRIYGRWAEMPEEYISELSFVQNLYIEVHGVCPSQEKCISLHSYDEVIVLMEMVYQQMQEEKKREYNRGYVDCAKTYQKE